MPFPRTSGKHDWTKRAAEDPYFWCVTNRHDWADHRSEYEQSAYRTFRESRISLDIFAGKTVLEIGCGTGRETHVIARHSQRIIGLDISRPMIATAKKDYPQLEFHETDGRTYPVPNSTIDIAYSFATLQHAPRQEDVWQNFREMYRVLKPGGQILVELRGLPGNSPGVVTWFKSFNTFWVATLRWRGLPIVFAKPFNSLYGACFRMRDMGNLFEIGFTNIRVSLENRHLWVNAEKPK